MFARHTCTEGLLTTYHQVRYGGVSLLLLAMHSAFLPRATSCVGFDESASSHGICPCNSSGPVDTIRWEYANDADTWEKIEERVAHYGGSMLSLHEAREYLDTHGAIVTGGQPNSWAAIGKNAIAKDYFSVSFAGFWNPGWSYQELCTTTGIGWSDLAARRSEYLAVILYRAAECECSAGFTPSTTRASSWQYQCHDNDALCEPSWQSLDVSVSKGALTIRSPTIKNNQVVSIVVSKSPVMITMDSFNGASDGEYVLIKICPSDVRSRLDDSPNGRSYDHESMDCELIKKCESSLCRHPYNKFLSTASKPSFIIIYNSGKDGRGMSLWWALNILPYESSCVTCEAGKYKSSKGSATCTECLINSYSLEGSDDPSDCKCRVGFTGNMCDVCAAGFFARQIHIEKQETSFSWKRAKRYVEAKGARLLTLPEVHGYLQEGTERINTILVGPTGESIFPHTVPYQSILGPQLLPFKVQGEFRFNKYQQGQIGALAFADNLQVPEAQAIQAVLSLLPAGTGQGRTFLVKGSWDYVPFGVSYQSRGDNAAHFNFKKDARNDGTYTPVGLSTASGSAEPWIGIVSHMKGGLVPRGFKVSFDDNARLNLWVAFHTAGHIGVLSEQARLDDGKWHVFEAIATATTIQVIVDGIAGSTKRPEAPLGSPNSLFGNIEHTDDFVIGQDKCCMHYGETRLFSGEIRNIAVEWSASRSLTSNERTMVAFNNDGVDREFVQVGANWGFIGQTVRNPEWDDETTAFNTHLMWIRPTCAACPAGKFKSNVGTAFCIDCPDDQDSTAGSVDCPFCVQGKYKNTKTGSCALQCPPGTTGPNGGPCLPCTEGKFKDVAGTDVCHDCAAGKYGSDSSSLDCLLCYEGSYSEAIGAVHISTCQKCGAGTYSGRGSSECSECEDGKYKSDQDDLCLDCPVYSWTLGKGKTNSSSCQCKAGFFGRFATTCIRCVPGKYKVDIGSGKCTDCKLGKYSIEVQAISAETCLQCPPFQTSNGSGATFCLCKLGYIRDCQSQNCNRCIPTELYDNGQCTTCPADASCDGSASIKCKPSTYLTTPHGSTKPVCQVCPRGALCPDGSGICIFETRSQLRSECPHAPPLLVGQWENDETSGIWKLVSCPLGSLLINSTAQASQCRTCETSSYSLDATMGCSADVCEMRECFNCPVGGATCIKGSLPPPHFIPRQDQAVWEETEMSDGQRKMRIVMCPPGYALIRTDSVPSGDMCERCPAGQYNIQGSFWEAGSSRTRLEMFCHTCPKFGAECPGGDVVISHENWFAIEELKYNQTLNVSRSERRLSKPRPNNLMTIVNVYQCSIGACAGNNTCLGQRTGVLCNMCPEGYSMEANACTKCDSNPDMQNTWQATLAVISIMTYVIILYLLGWTAILPLPQKLKNTTTKLKGKVEKWMGAAENASSIFQDSSIKIGLQGFKIFIAYFQIIVGFMPLKVDWPDAILSSLSALKKLSLSFEFFRFPGLSCLFLLKYESEMLLNTCVPLFVLACLALPVLVAWRMYVRGSTTHTTTILKNTLTCSNLPPELICSQSPNTETESVVLAPNTETASVVLEKTTVAAWNNMLLFIFLVFPNASLWALQGFMCRDIGGKAYLSYDLRETCPWRISTPSSISVYTVIFSIIWPFGIPFILLCTMVSFKVPVLAKRKVTVRAVEHLLMKYKQDTKSDAFDTITTPGGGETLNMLTLEDLIGLRQHDWLCKRIVAHLPADKTVAATLKELTSTTGGNVTQEASLTTSKKNSLDIKERKEKAYIVTKIQNAQMKEIWEFSQQIHELDENYDEESLPDIFLHVVGKLEMKLKHKMMQQDGSSYNDGEWWKWQEFVTRVSAHEQDLKDILIQHIEQIALTLRAEGILLLPPIEWDGRLGLEEQRVLDRLGFLLNAYHVEVFYWELVELVRKLILTSLLVIAYDGSASQLTGSLLATNVFLILHMRVDPFLNKHLNEFQRLVLISQWLTIFGGIMFLLKDYMNNVLEVNITTQMQQERDFVAAILIFVNIFAAFLYPIYRIILAISGMSDAHSFQVLMDGLRRLRTHCAHTPSDDESDAAHVATIRDAKNLLQEQSHCDAQMLFNVVNAIESGGSTPCQQLVDNPAPPPHPPPPTYLTMINDPLQHQTAEAPLTALDPFTHMSPTVGNSLSAQEIGRGGKGKQDKAIKVTEMTELTKDVQASEAIQAMHQHQARNRDRKALLLRLFETGKPHLLAWMFWRWRSNHANSLQPENNTDSLQPENHIVTDGNPSFSCSPGKGKREFAVGSKDESKDVYCRPPLSTVRHGPDDSMEAGLC